jgi:hypothetical protein
MARILTKLSAGSFLASSPFYLKEKRLTSTPPSSETEQLFARKPSALFTACPLNPTKLSPFYYKTPPDIEACNMDLEREIMTCALRRLSKLPTFNHRRSPEPGQSQGPTWEPADLSEEEREGLARDTESYIASFLSRPHNLGYPSLDPAVAPDSSRGWAVACFLYLQLVLRRISIDSNLFLFLLDQLKIDIMRTEEAMSIGAYSADMWFWQTVIGNYTVEVAFRTEGKKSATLDAMKEWYLEKLRAACRKMQITTWEALRAALEKVMWVKEFEGDVVIRDAWTSAVVDENTEMSE